MSEPPPPATPLEPSPDPAPGPAAALVAQAPEVAAPVATEADAAEAARIDSLRPSYLFFGIVSALALLADVGTKAWAEIVLSKRTMLDPSITIIKNHLTFTLAYNKGGAWGLLQTASETIRKPFFLIVSVLAIAFIVSLYSRLAPAQRALKWGLPLVLGGALGNLSDRVTRSSVIDFIDYRADWIESMNLFLGRFFKTWSITDHWPTFNVADIFICIGVGLMAVDMVTSRRKAKAAQTASEPAPQEKPAISADNGTDAPTSAPAPESLEPPPASGPDDKPAA
jgi:signal peptidase II